MARNANKSGRGPSPAKTAETQARIVKAALGRFLSDGFEKTRMIDVAQDAGLAKGTLYLYFSTKEALFEGVISMVMGNSVRQFGLEPPYENESTRDFVKRILKPLVADEQAELRQAFLRLLLTEGQRFPSLLASYRKITLDPVLTAARRIGQRARERGEINSDGLERIPMLLLAPGMLIAVWNYIFPNEKFDIEKTFDEYIDLIFIDLNRNHE